MAKKESEEKAYLNPVKAEEHKVNGNQFMEKGDYPSAIKEYSEGISLDPTNKSLYSNRSLSYINLMELAHAAKDADQCLELDHGFVEAYVRRGKINQLSMEYQKALGAYDAGLKLDPHNLTCLEEKQRTMMLVQSNMHSPEGEQQAKKAMQDPEIQMLLNNPRIAQEVKNLQENKQSAQRALSNPFISQALNKLTAAGIVKAERIKSQQKQKSRNTGEFMMSSLFNNEYTHISDSNNRIFSGSGASKNSQMKKSTIQTQQ